MKTTFIFLSLVITGFSFSQFSESFFERLSPSGGSNFNHYFGTEIQNGALAVRFADSLNTEVQWARLDLEGNYQTYSANLPTDYISPNERIIELYELGGTTQFIVTQDSASMNPEGIRIHVFQTYTLNIGEFFFPVQLRKGWFQSYLYNGKIYVFLVDENNDFIRLKIDPMSLALEENLSLGNVYFNAQSPYQNYKKIHVLFQDADNMQVFTNSNSDLVRIKIENNIPQPVETLPLGIVKVFGVNQSSNQIICLHNSFFRVKKYALNFSDPLTTIALVDSFDLQGLSPGGPGSSWNYACSGSKEIFIYGYKALELDQNILVNQNDILDYCTYTQVEYLNGKPLLFGSRQLNEPNNGNGPGMTFLFASWGDLSKLSDFKEYSTIADFGSYKTRFSTGNYFIRPPEGSASGDFIFSHMIYAASAYFVGKSNGNYYGENSYYMGNNYKPGPYTDPSQYSHEIVHQYNESFYVDLDMLNYHVFAINTNLQGYVMPKAIRDWPAHGDVSKGQSANLAPFIDVNQNGSYEPALGEYPAFPGTRCLFNITHQHEQDAGNTGSGLELHSYLYNFDCADSLDSVIFLKMEVFNRGSINYDSLSSGIFSDFDLGGYSDDYIGTNVEKGLVYGFNGDNYDESQSGVQGFNDSLPTIGNLFLKGVRFPANGSDDQTGVSASQTVNGFGFNDQVIDNEYKGLEFSFAFTSFAGATQTDPTTSPEFFNYLNGKWRFGDTLLFGGTGFTGSSGSTTIQAKYIYPDISDPLHYGTAGIDPGFTWNEMTNNNPASDRRILGSFGSTPLQSGESISYHSAYLSGKRIPGMGQSQIDLYAKATHVKNAFNSNLTSCGQTFGNLTEDMITSVPKTNQQKRMKIYPNPAKDQFVVEFSELNEPAEILIFDINGKLLLQQKMENKLTSVDVSRFENGMYLVKINTGSFSETLRMVKN